jgi:hypothetical protein
MAAPLMSLYGGIMRKGTSNQASSSRSPIVLLMSGRAPRASIPRETLQLRYWFVNNSWFWMISLICTHDVGKSPYIWNFHGRIMYDCRGSKFISLWSSMGLEEWNLGKSNEEMSKSTLLSKSKSYRKNKRYGVFQKVCEAIVYINPLNGIFSSNMQETSVIFRFYNLHIFLSNWK